jgi:hypothetical protein
MRTSWGKLRSWDILWLHELTNNRRPRPERTLYVLYVHTVLPRTYSSVEDWYVQVDIRTVGTVSDVEMLCCQTVSTRTIVRTVQYCHLKIGDQPVALRDRPYS